MNMQFAIKYLDNDLYGEEGVNYATARAAAVDLRTDRNAVLPPQTTMRVGTGIAVDMRQQQVAGLVIPRSGMGSVGLVLANVVGLIDPDYQGEIFITLLNRSLYRDMTITRGQRVAQLLFIPIVVAELIPVEEFVDHTSRGSGGFGSTGIM